MTSMIERFLNTRTPSIISALAFVVASFMFCAVLAGARDSAELTPSMIRGLLLWGIVALAMMLLFCLCLAKVTRYQRSLPDEEIPFRDTKY